MSRYFTLGRSIALVLALPLLLGSQPLGPSLDGRLVSRVNDQPISDAAVTLRVMGRSVVTDGEGRFSFEDVDFTDPDTLLIEHREFRPVRIPLGMPGTTAQWTLTITMIPGPIGRNGQILGDSSNSEPGA